MSNTNRCCATCTHAAKRNDEYPCKSCYTEVTYPFYVSNGTDLPLGKRVSVVIFDEADTDTSVSRR